MKQLLTVLTLAVTFSLVGCGGSGPAPGDTVKDFAYAMEAGDVDKVKETMPVLETMLGNEKLEKQVTEASAEMKEEGGIESVTIDSEEISEDGKSAKVTATIKRADGETETEDFALNKTDEGKWIIVIPDDEKGGGGINVGPGSSGGPDITIDGDLSTPDE